MAGILYVGNRNYSSWSIRGSLLVRQSGIECDELVIPLDTDAGKTKMKRVSPSQRLPVLHYQNLVIWDSLAIAEFLHERMPEAGLWPRDASARAIARSASAEMHSGFGALRSQLPMDIRATRVIPITPEVRQDSDRIEALWSACREWADDGDFLFGAWSAADAMFAPVVSRFRTCGVQLSPASQQYADAVWAWPAMASLVAEAKAEPWTIDLGI